MQVMIVPSNNSEIVKKAMIFKKGLGLNYNKSDKNQFPENDLKG